jgi:hypothetical protein
MRAKEWLMSWKFPTALLAGAAAVLVIAALPAEAQSNRNGAANGQLPGVSSGSPRSRVIVRPRSYLDPGREVQPYSQSYTNYLFLGTSPYDSFGPGGNPKRNYPNPWSFSDPTGWR